MGPKELKSGLEVDQCCGDVGGSISYIYMYCSCSEMYVDANSRLAQNLLDSATGRCLHVKPLQ